MIVSGQDTTRDGWRPVDLSEHHHRRAHDQPGTPSPVSRADLVVLLADEVEARSADHPARVAVDGCASSGKTTLADELAAALRERGRPVVRACVDDFHLPRDERYRRDLESPDSAQACYHRTFDYPALKRLLLEPMGPHGTRTHRTTLSQATAATAAPEAVLIFDGVFLMRPELRDWWALTVHLAVRPEEILRRARIRDLHLFGTPERVDHRYRNRYLPAQQLYHADHQPLAHADFVIGNDDPAAPLPIRTPRPPDA